MSCICAQYIISDVDMYWVASHTQTVHSGICLHVVCIGVWVCIQVCVRVGKLSKRVRCPEVTVYSH